MKGTTKKVGSSIVRTLKDSELRYRRLFEAAQDGILILDARTGMIEDVNPYLLKMLGYSREEFVEKKLWEVGAFKDIEASQDDFKALQENEYIRYENLPLKAKDGRLIQVEFVSNVYQVGSEKVIQCNIRDITERKQVEQTLRSLARFPAENPNPVLRIARDGNLLYANKAAFVLLADWKLKLGKPAPEVLKSPACEVFETQTTKTVEIPCGERTFSIDIAPAPDEEYANLFGRDITDRKQADEMLLESELRFRTLFDRALDGILIADMETRRFFMGNSAICQMLGYTHDELSSIGVDEIHPPEHLPYVVAQFNRQARGEIELAKNLPVQRKDGSVFYADINSTSVTLSGHTYVMGIFRDITERKRAEDALKESEEMLRSIFVSTPDAITVVDLDGNIKFCNQSTANIHAYSSADQLIGKSYLELIAEEDHSRALESMQQVMLHGFVKDVPFTGLKQNGEKFAGELSVSMIKESSGRPDGFVGITKDVTERKQAESQVNEQLDELQRWQAATLGRESRILDLKREVNDLLGKTGQPPRYASAESQEKKEE